MYICYCEHNRRRMNMKLQNNPRYVNSGLGPSWCTVTMTTAAAAAARLLVTLTFNILTPKAAHSEALASTSYVQSFPAVWNSLPKTVLNSDSLAVFKSRLKTLYIQLYSPIAQVVRKNKTTITIIVNVASPN